MKKAIICDIDGCLLETSFIFDEIEQKGLSGDDKWRYFNRNANGFRVKHNEVLGEILTSFSKQGFEIILLTARSEEIRIETHAKIQQHFKYGTKNGFDFLLFMRGVNDFSRSCDSKEKHLEELKKNYLIVLAIDDDEDNCKMFQENDILTMKVINKVEVPA